MRDEADQIIKALNRPVTDKETTEHFNAFLSALCDACKEHRRAEAKARFEVIQGEK